MAGGVSIPDDRPLTPEEASLVRWLLEHGGAAAAGFLPQLSRARVVSRCACGCVSVDFAIGGVTPPTADGLRVLADYEYRSAAGDPLGVFVFERAGLLAGLEVWSLDGRCIPATLPRVEQLLPLGSVWDA